MVDKSRWYILTLQGHEYTIKVADEQCICLGGLMDKVVDSGSTDAGSIPVRDVKRF